jgi:hypothetical protein
MVYPWSIRSAAHLDDKLSSWRPPKCWPYFIILKKIFYRIQILKGGLFVVLRQDVV